MIDSLLNNVALFAEYDFQLGGAQRLLATVAKHMNKPIYVLSDNDDPMPVWDVKPIPGIPNSPILFSIVVDRYNFRVFEGKHQIKFCHSGRSLENFLNNTEAKRVVWVTHRYRAYKHWKNKGFNIYYIEDGYIPYDNRQLQIFTERKEDTIAFISRICEDKKPAWAIEVARRAGVPLVIAGSWEFQDYVINLKRQNPDINFVEPTDGNIGITEERKNELLMKSKVLLHPSNGGLRDYFEYSILDGMLYGCVPLCITPDSIQFEKLEQLKIGKVASNSSDGADYLKNILANYCFYLENVSNFMNDFLLRQEALWMRWQEKLEEIIQNEF